MCAGVGDDHGRIKIKINRILFALPLLCVGGVLLLGWFYWYAPLNCSQVVDSRLLSLLEERFTELELRDWIAARYGLSLEDIRESRLAEDGKHWMYWSIGNVSYSIRYKGGQVESAHVFRSGLIRTFTMDDIVACFGEPEHAHAVWIPFEMSYTHYTLWYPSDGIVFQGKIKMNKPEFATDIKNEYFEQYVLFRPVPLTEAVTAVYPSFGEMDIQRLLDYIQTWQGDWDTIKVHEEQFGFD